MSNRAKANRMPAWRRPVPAADTPKGQLEAIYQAAPDVASWGGGKWAMYAVAGCCWWTSDPANLGSTKGLPGKRLPCCPHCGAMLMQAPLDKFLKAAATDETHYGPGGLATFVSAHNAPCHPRWEEYPLPSGPSLKALDVSIEMCGPEAWEPGGVHAPPEGEG